MTAGARSSGTPSMLALIERKKAGGVMEEAELEYLCNGVAAGTLADYQVAAWLMATWFRGMDDAETLALTRAMVGTGATLDWSGLDRPVVDKHSTGGVGDKTSLVLVPLVAACGLAFSKMSGRGLGHTGGTIDKLESIPGFTVQLSPERLREQIRRIGCALVGQSPELVPADGALYALRDVTGTVDSVPLIASSVMSKKLAAGASAIVLDVKFGSGAFIPDAADARNLARAMVAIGVGAGRRVRAVMSAMDRPLGESVGNALEVREAIATLAGAGDSALWSLARELGVQLLQLTQVSADRAAAEARLEDARASGRALHLFEQLVEAQGGDPRIVSDPRRLPSAPAVRLLRAGGSGWIGSIAPRPVAEAVLRLGGARRAREEGIDPAVGVRLLARVGDPVRRGDPLAEIHARSDASAESVASLLQGAFHLAESPAECLEAPPHELVEVDPSGMS